jgi:glycerophosphoryl diester phosphodiesterase
VIRSWARAAALTGLLVTAVVVPGFPVLGTGAGTAAAGTASEGADPWPQRRFLNMAHAGGENEASADTMYAFKRAVRLGADMIELDVESFLHNARLLARLLNHTRHTDVVVTSFNDEAPATFHALAPGMNELIFFTGVRPIDGTVALQIPVAFNGVQVATKEFIARAHADGYAVHVWFSGTAPEDETTYNALIDACADGLMVAWPALLERILNERHIARPDAPGVDPCGIVTGRS